MATKAKASPKSKRMSDREIGAILSALNANAEGMSAGRLADERTRALNYYMGEMAKDMPSVEGRSKAVSTDVFDTIEGMMPDLLEIFAGSEEVVKFNPVGQEDVEAAKQETDYVNHVFMQKNPGFMVLYSFIKDALLSKVGIVKVHWEEEDQEERETYVDQTPDALAMILQRDPDAEITEHNEHEGLHDFTIVARKNYGCARVENVPPEEFRIAKDARCIKDASYCAHEVSRTESDLIAEGFDADQVRKLPTYGETQDTESAARDTVSEGASASGDDGLNKAMRPIRVTEHYVKLDYEGDGKARLYRVTTGGEQTEVLRYKGQPSVTPMDFVPFAAMTPVIMTHRFFGRSIADLVMEIQRIKTALLRALLDNAYLSTNPRTEVPESHANENTLDDLLVSRPGGIVRTRQPGGLNILKHPDVGGDVYPLFQYQDQVREWRTGVTRQAIGLDPDALNNQTATAAAQLYNAAKARLRMIARIFAETGIKDMFWLLHATIRKHGSAPDTVELRNRWVTIDPRQWRSRKDLTAKVGLGTGSKTEQMGQTIQLMNVQKEMLAGGKSNLVSDKNLYNAAKDLVALTNRKDVDSYFTDPETQPPPQPQPDPEMIKIQGQLEVEKMQAQADIATTEKKAQLDAQLKLAIHQLTLDQKRQEHAMKMEEMRSQHAIRMEDHREQRATRAFEADAGTEAEGAGGQGNARSAMLFADLADQIAQVRSDMGRLKAEKEAPKRVQKLPDGSWVAQPVEAAAGVA